ncbi:MAG TPA: alanine racemase [Candidatus Acidoferrales bacterium]|nr:alanine racemase [Candidatus Acidoferrales bacterium]
MNRTVHVDGRPVWAEISLKAILHNLRVIRKQIGPKRKVLAVVKSNAYGLGAVPISKALEKAAVEWFGVTWANEGVELREAGLRKRILILTGFWPGEERRFIEYGLTPAVTRVEDVAHLERAAKSVRTKSVSHSRSGAIDPDTRRFRFHLKINTGMNRLGIAPSEIDAFAAELAKCKHIELEGTFTHLASSEDLESPQSDDQERVFRQSLDRLRTLGISPGIVHMANSGAICARPSTWFDMVRPGAILYGYYQSFAPSQLLQDIRRTFPLEPCLSMRARIISLRDVSAGQGVGYAARFVTEGPSRIAVINAGYADGIVRQRTNHGCAIVRGKRVPLVGTISMDLTMLDVTGVPEAAIGDVVTIYGKDGNAQIVVSDVAREINTVTSELLCALDRRVPRYYL